MFIANAVMSLLSTLTILGLSTMGIFYWRRVKGGNVQRIPYVGLRTSETTKNSLAWEHSQIAGAKILAYGGVIIGAISIVALAVSITVRPESLLSSLLIFVIWSIAYTGVVIFSVIKANEAAKRTGDGTTGKGE
jgi:hypothetical protein